MAGGSDGDLSAAQAAGVAVEQLGELVRKQLLGVTSVRPTEDCWVVEVEVLEESRVPSSADMLALYEVELDPDGDLLSYRRTRRYSRGKADSGSEAPERVEVGGR